MKPHHGTEKEQLRADYLRASSGRSGSQDWRRLPAARGLRADLLSVEESVRRPGRKRATAALKQLEEENASLKRLVADLSLYKRMLQEVLEKKV